jgi:hypothetical protein
MQMKINFLATKKNMALLKIGAWARFNGFEEPTVRRILNGAYPYDQGDIYKAIIRKLREEGYLVEEPDEQEKAA